MLMSTAVPLGEPSGFGSIVLVSSSSLITALLTVPLPVWPLRSGVPSLWVRAIQAGEDTDSAVSPAVPSPSPNLSFLCPGTDESRIFRRCRVYVSSEYDSSYARIDLLHRGTCEHVRYRSSSSD